MDGELNSYTVNEVVALSRRSEATVRRMIGKTLVAVEGAGSIRLSAESVHAWCDQLRRRAPEGSSAHADINTNMPATENGFEDALDRLVDVQSQLLQAEQARDAAVEDQQRLVVENEQLRYTIQSLRQAISIFNTELGSYTSPKIIPDN